MVNLKNVRSEPFFFCLENVLTSDQSHRLIFECDHKIRNRMTPDITASLIKPSFSFSTPFPEEVKCCYCYSRFPGITFSFSMSHVSTRTPQHLRHEKPDILNLSRSDQVTSSSLWTGFLSPPPVTAAYTEWSWKKNEKPVSKPLSLDCKSFICTPFGFLFQIFPPQVAVSGLLHGRISRFSTLHLLSKQQFGQWCLRFSSNWQNCPWALMTAAGSITRFATRTE